MGKKSNMIFGACFPFSFLIYLFGGHFNEFHWKTAELLKCFSAHKEHVSKNISLVELRSKAQVIF